MGEEFIGVRLDTFPLKSTSDLKFYAYTKTCMQMFIVALFLIAQNLEQPGCPSVGEQINCGTSKQWNIQH